jgi:hypothetical protein
MAGHLFAPEIEKNDELGKSPRLRLLYAIVVIRKIRLARFFVSDYDAEEHMSPRINTDCVTRIFTD